MAADLVTARYRLRLAQDADGPACMALYADPRVMRDIGPPRDAADLAPAFALAVRHNRAMRPGHRYWTIRAREDGRFAGITALRRDGARAELGIMLVPDVWNTGVAKEAFRPLLDHAFGAMALETVDAERRDDGHARLIDRLLLPLGFVDAPATAPGLRRWALPRDRWRSAADDRRLAPFHARVSVAGSSNRGSTA